MGLHDTNSCCSECVGAWLLYHAEYIGLEGKVRETHQRVQVECADIGGGDDGEGGKDGCGARPFRPPIDAAEAMLGCCEYSQDDGDGREHDGQAQADGTHSSQHVQPPAPMPHDVYHQDVMHGKWPHLQHPTCLSPSAEGNGV